MVLNVYILHQGNTSNPARLSIPAVRFVEQTQYLPSSPSATIPPFLTEAAYFRAFSTLLNLRMQLSVRPNSFNQLFAI